MIDLDITLLVQIINFLVLMFILNIVLYKPLMNIMEERQRRIDETNNEARILEETIEKKIADYEERLRQARSEAVEQREEIKQQGVDAAKGILAQARNEVSEMIQGFKAKVESEKEEALKTLKRQTFQIAVEIAEKVLGRSVQ